MIIKKLLIILSTIILISGCRTIENVTESESQKVKTENIKTDTEVISEKITTVEIPIEYFKYFPIPEKDSSSKTKIVAKQDTSSKTVTVTTKENTVTRQTQDKKVQEKTDTETKQKTTKTPLFNWNYIWVFGGVLLLLIVLKYTLR